MPQAIENLATQFAHYALVNRLAVGEVYELWQVVSTAANTRDALLYRLRPAYTANRDISQRFIDEGRRIMKLSHPGFARVCEVVAERDETGVIVEAVTGSSLRKVIEMAIQCNNTVPVWFALDVTRRVCDVLDYAHSVTNSEGVAAPLFHLHLGLEQVVISSKGSVSVHGFGIPRRTTRDSWSDEEFDACSLTLRNARTDVTSAAKLLYQLLTRVTLDDALPASSALSRLVVSALAPASIYAPWVPRSVDAVLRRALASYERDGFSTIVEFREALIACLPDAQKSVTDDHLAAIVQLLMQTVARLEPVVSNDSESSWEADPLSEERPVARLRREAGNSGGSAEQAVSTLREVFAPAFPLVEIEPSFCLDGVFDLEFEQERPTMPNCEPPLLLPPGPVEETELVPCPPVQARNDDVKRSEPSAYGVSGDAAIAVFERGLDCLRVGDFEGAEGAWSRALFLDPGLRAAATNLNLLRKRRHPELPPP